MKGVPHCEASVVSDSGLVYPQVRRHRAAFNDSDEDKSDHPSKTKGARDILSKPIVARKYAFGSISQSLQHLHRFKLNNLTASRFSKVSDVGDRTTPNLKTFESQTGCWLLEARSVGAGCACGDWRGGESSPASRWP